MFKQHFLYFKRFVAFLAICSLMIVSMPLNSNASQDSAGDQNEKVYICDGYTVTFKIETVWNTGYNAGIVIQNTGNEAINDWYMYFKYDGEIPNMWNASVFERSSSYMVLTNGVWNKDVFPNGTASFGFTGSGDFPGFPESIKVTSGYDPSAMEGGSNDHGVDGGQTLDDGLDSDEDGLTDAFEEAIGTDPEKTDTDEDGLSDYQEVYLTLTDPTLTDTNDDGILDPDEDIDGDGLGNLDELNGGTDPGNPDTDRDDLNDYDEMQLYGCDPLNPDSDGDGLCDGDDVLLGFSPTMPDTDLNGILDSAETVYQTTENDFAYEDAHGLTGVSVSLSVSGNADKEIEITNVYEFDAQSREVVGLIGAPIEITSDVEFEAATITFSYDEGALGDTSEENLSLMWYDEANHWYQILDQDCTVDPINNTVSCTTTHFSKYMLVDALKWFETWNEDIDYHEEEPVELVYNPAQLFVIQDLGSANADEVDLVEEIKNTLDDTSNAFKWYKEATIIMESGRCQHWYPGSYYGPAFREYYTDLGYLITHPDGSYYIHTGFNGLNLDSTLNSIIYTCDKYQDIFSYYNTAIVLITDRSSDASEETLQACAERGLEIYTVDIKNDAEDSSLKNLSDMTNGNHYYGEITQNPTMLVNSLAYVMNGFTSYGSDSDEDGLLDNYEIYGVRTIVGKLIKTDPDDKDSDDDNLTDYEELGMVYDLNLYIGFGVFKNCRFVIYHSNPTKPDSDDDGIEDDKDSFPLKRNEVFVYLNGYTSPHFLNVENTNLQYHNNNSVIAGGDQHWWPGTGKEYEGIFDGFFERFPDYVSNKNFRMNGFGCGVIAATDLELYLCQENGYSIPNQPNLFSNNASLISQSDYMSTAEYNRDNVFILNDYYVNYVVGVKPTDLESGMESFLKYNGFLNPTAEWRASADKEIVLNSIERMISENRPIVFSYHTFKDKYEDGICLYKNVEDAKNDNRSTIPIKSHYMNIIGYVKYLNDTCDTYRYLLIVVSNGEIYYINYDFYAAHLDMTTNILEIRT